MRLSKWVLSLALFAIPASLAMAQSYGAGMGIGLNFGNLHMNNLLSSTVADQVDEEPTNATNQVAILYTASKSRRTATLTKIVNDFSRLNPEQATFIKGMLLGDGSGDVIERMAPLISVYGFRVDNLADAYSIFWITAWQASRGNFDSQSSHEQAQAVKKQVAAAFTSAPQMGKVSDADKQAYAEALLVQATIVSINVGRAKADPSAVPKFREDVREMAEALGVDVDSMDLTPTGFVNAKQR